ncbi:MAG: chemotaxis protein CheW [Gammaproteobacteria bacterium]
MMNDVQPLIFPVPDEFTETSLEVVDQPSLKDDVFGSFFIDDAEYALTARRLKDVVAAPAHFTRQPLAPDYLLGIMRLRDMTLPVIDLRCLFSIAGLSTDNTEARIAIVEYRGQHVGMLFDRTGEVFRGNSKNATFTNYSDTSDSGIAIGAFRFDDGSRFVQVLDARAVIECNGAPLMESNSNRHKRAIDKKPVRGKRQQSISFRLGESEIGVSLTTVREVIHTNEIDTNVFSGALFAGTMSLRGVTVTLLDLAVVLGIGADRTDIDLAEKQIIIVSTEGRKFGLVVDEITGFEKYYDDQLSSFPVFGDQQSRVFSGVLNTEDKRDILQLAVERLLEMEEVLGAIDACDSLYDTKSIDSVEAANEVIVPKETYLTFNVGRVYGMRILDIAEVVEFPDDMIEPPKLKEHICGILDLRGELISVIDARKLYNIDSADAASTSNQIIIFEHDAKRYGIAIDSVESIEQIPTNRGRPIPDSNAFETSAIVRDLHEAICYNSKSDGKLRDLLVIDIAAMANRISNSESGPMPLI